MKPNCNVCEKVHIKLGFSENFGAFSRYLMPFTRREASYCHVALLYLKHDVGALNSIYSFRNDYMPEVTERLAVKCQCWLICYFLQLAHEAVIGNPKCRWFDKTQVPTTFKNGMVVSNYDVSFFL